MGPVGRRFFTFQNFSKFITRTPLTPRQNRVNWVSQERLKQMAEENYQRKLNEAFKAYEQKGN
jgi:hypothetical protein